MEVDPTKPVAVILGAGFSRVADVPIASELFARRPEVDRVIRAKLVDRVVTRWDAWRSRTNGATEEYLAELARTNQREWHDAVWFVGLTIALRMGQVKMVGGSPTITRTYLKIEIGVELS